jgi:hypothetical protein
VRTPPTASYIYDRLHATSPLQQQQQQQQQQQAEGPKQLTTLRSVSERGPDWISKDVMMSLKQALLEIVTTAVSAEQVLNNVPIQHRGDLNYYYCYYY